MRTNRRTWSGLAAAALLIVAAALGWFVLTGEPDHPLSRQNYQRIKAGMTRREVEQILGGPPGVIGRAPEGPWFVALVEQEGPTNSLGTLDGIPAIWSGARGQILVMFDTGDQSGRVLGKQFYRPAPRR